MLLAGIILPVAFVSRDPIRQVPSAPLAIVSPASGKVVAIEKVSDKWLKRPAIRVRIQMSFLDVHIIRSPIEGKIRNQWTSNGEETGVKRRYTYWIRTDENDDVIYSIAVGARAPFLKINLRCGERVGQGQKAGYVYFNGIFDVLVPEQTKMDLAVGDIVNSGSSILAHIIHGDGSQQAA
jgi:phosphatidylserine decarboxylase